MTSFGAVYPAHESSENLPWFVAEVKARGYDEVWVVEDCFMSDGLTLAARALDRSCKLRMGVDLVATRVRSPAIVAMEIASIARDHPGRLTVAFGRWLDSWMQQTAGPQGRLVALGEVVTAVRMLLAGETVSAVGTVVTLESVALKYPPAIVPEILIGCASPEEIALAGRRADGLLLPEGSGPRFIDHARVLLHGAAPAFGAPEIVVRAWLAAGERTTTRAQLAEGISRWLESGLYPGPAGADAGAPNEATSPSETVSDALANELAITGPPNACIEAIHRFLAAGADRLVLSAIGPHFADQYAMVANQVLPHVRTCGS